MTEKILAVLLAAVMILSLFVGCGNDAADSPEDFAPDTTVSEADPDADNNEEPTVYKEPKIELSGNADDKFIAEENCYAESERVVMFIQKGREVRGDMLKVTEKVMDDLTAATGMPFERNYNDGLTEEISFHFGEGAFEGINEGNEKVYVILTELSDTVPTASESGIVVDSIDYDYKELAYQTIYHELAHVNHLMNGANLGSALSEGFAVYASEKALKQQNMPLWNQYAYYFPYNLDESAFSEGEEGFRYDFPEKDFNYHYGFRFMHFLADTYGEDCFKNILDKASAERFSPAYTIGGPENQEEITNENLINIVKSQTDDDVFDKFSKWNKNHWNEKIAAFEAYNASIGE